MPTKYNLKTLHSYASLLPGYEPHRRLREMGIIDEHGNQLKTVEPVDMLDPEADFGG